MDEQLIKELLVESEDVVLEPNVLGLVSPSTMAAETLQFLGQLINYLKPHNVLEFGSGLSTLFISELISDVPNAHLYSVDHSSHYQKKTRNLVKHNSNIDCYLSQIELYHFKLRAFTTYGRSFLKNIPDEVSFDMVLIDGPPGFRFGREAPLYQISERLKPETVIVLDDASRLPEQAAIEGWRRTWCDNVTVVLIPDLKKGLGLIQINEPWKQARVPFGINQTITSWWRAWRVLKSNS